MPLGTIDFGRYYQEIERASPVQVRGRVKDVAGLLVRASLPQAFVGELCLIYNPRSRIPTKAEVVGFHSGDVLLMPIGELTNIGLQSDVESTGNCLTVKVGEGLLGRVLNGIGEPIDIEFAGPLTCTGEYPVYAPPPNALRRRRVTSPISIGVRAIDGLLTCGEGQRVGLFAAAGVGKSTLLGMIARNSEADVNVIALVGERGREVRDFLEQDLGPEGLKRSVVVCATSNEPSLVRLKAAHVGTAIAEYFRDQGKRVMLLMDSVTRFARAQGRLAWRWASRLRARAIPHPFLRNCPGFSSAPAIRKKARSPLSIRSSSRETTLMNRSPMKSARFWTATLFFHAIWPPRGIIRRLTCWKASAA